MNMKAVAPLSNKPMIVIPSHNRAGQLKVLTSIPDELMDVTYVAITPDQEEAYKKANPGVQLLIVHPDVKCIAQKRQACIDMLPKGKIIMLDDKIELYLKRFEFQANGMPKIPSGTNRYMTKTNNKFMDLYKVMDEMLDDYPQVGISAREGNSMKSGYGKEIQKVYGAQGLRSDIFEKEDIRFDGMFLEDPLCGFYEDYYVTLCLIEKGYKNYGLYDYVYNHHHNSKGGNSGSRTAETQEHCVKKLQKRFGEEFIKIYQYDGRSQWDNLPNRWEIKTMFIKKFYNASVARIEEELNPTISLFDMGL